MRFEKVIGRIASRVVSAGNPDRRLEMMCDKLYDVFRRLSSGEIDKTTPDPADRVWMGVRASGQEAVVLAKRIDLSRPGSSWEKAVSELVSKAIRLALSYQDLSTSRKIIQDQELEMEFDLKAAKRDWESLSNEWAEVKGNIERLK